jgi:hypothetical protein
MIGKYVIVRFRNKGINTGYVEMADKTGISKKSGFLVTTVCDVQILLAGSSG